MKLLKGRIVRVCRRKLRSGTLTEKQAAAVKAVLADQLALTMLTERVAEIPQPVGALGDGKILDWLTEVFIPKILPLILAILKALGI